MRFKRSTGKASIRKNKKIQQEIEHTCDELDYAGSFIYDEYPDKINLNRTGRQICERLRKMRSLEKYR